jgi:hypothetical protein
MPSTGVVRVRVGAGSDEAVRVFLFAASVPYEEMVERNAGPDDTESFPALGSDLSCSFKLWHGQFSTTNPVSAMVYVATLAEATWTPRSNEARALTLSVALACYEIARVLDFDGGDAAARGGPPALSGHAASSFFAQLEQALAQIQEEQKQSVFCPPPLFSQPISWCDL